MQRWFSHTVSPDAADPYFLYAASNAGSFVGLALYPCVLEPGFTLTRQASGWSLAYIGFVMLIAFCGVLAYRARQSDTSSNVLDEAPPTRRSEDLLWMALAFVPASLLYGVTAQLSTDFPPIPLLWVVPLAIYLLTFIIGFSTGLEKVRRLGRLLPTFIVGAVALFVIGSAPATWALIGFIKLCCFGMIALALHSELARRRPATHRLTRFFLLVSLGGVLAGVLNGLVAPLIFSDYWEYPITLLLAAMLLPTVAGVVRRPIRPVFLWTSVAILCSAIVATRAPGLHLPFAFRFAAFAIGLMLCIRVPARWTAAMVLVLLAFVGHLSLKVPNIIYQARSFYGVYKVQNDDQAKTHSLIHGTTLHGAQVVGDTPNTPQALKQATYYGPVAPVLESVRDKHSLRIGVVGLGAGTIACFATASDSTTFFEIDPLVEKIARDPKYFTYLADCPGTKSVVLGDARLTLARTASRSFDVLIIDAFSSDAIPMHLLTTEAFALYRRTLVEDGILMVHLTNRYLDLQPVVKGSAVFPGYASLILNDIPSPLQIQAGHLPSKWAVIAPADRARALESDGFKPTTGRSVLWTDGRSSLFTVVSWWKLLDVRLMINSVKANAGSPRKY